MTGGLGVSDEFILTGLERDAGAALCFFSLPASHPFEELADVLHPRETAYYHTLKSEKRKRSYLVGRYAAKKAVAAFVQETDPRRILIQQGIFNQPIATCEDARNVQVSITHCDGLGAAIAFPEAHPMGIDLERIKPGKREAIESQMTKAEREGITALSFPYDMLLTLAWTAKEALSKVLKTGLTTPFTIFAMSEIKVQNDCFTGSFENFPQYKALSFETDGYVCSIVCPKKTGIEIDFSALKEQVRVG
jgi:phosphopantetheinyl transferase